MECQPDERRINVGSVYYTHYDANNTAFDESLQQDEIIVASNPSLRGNDMKVVRILRAILNEPTLTEDQEAVIKRLCQAYENGDIPQNVTKNIIKEPKVCDKLLYPMVPKL